METFSPDQWRELFAGCHESAFHLEMRDTCAVEDEKSEPAWQRFAEMRD